MAGRYFDGLIVTCNGNYCRLEHRFELAPHPYYGQPFGRKDEYVWQPEVQNERITDYIASKGWSTENGLDFCPECTDRRRGRAQKAETRQNHVARRELIDELAQLAMEFSR